MRKVIVVPVVIGAMLIGVKVRFEAIQKTALLGTVKILRKVLSL